MEVLVEFDYAAEEPDELTIKKGDIIKDVSQFEEGWYIGNLNGKVGVFPDNFVKTIESSAGSKKQTIPVVETVKEPRAESKKVTETESEENRLGSTAKSQKVTGIGLGNIFSGQPIQLRQTSLKEVIKDTESNTDKTVSSVKGDGSNQSTRTDHVRARFDYQPKQLDELELHVDDIIQILDRNLPDEGWWKGKNLTTKKIGVFPDNFVIPVTEVPNDAVDRTQNTASTNTNTAPEPPKVAAKPSPLLGNSTGHMGLKPTGANNTIAQRDNPKVAVASAPNITSGGRLTTNTVATSATSVTSTVPTPSGGLSVGSVMGGSGGASRWRTTSEHYDVSKSRTDETHGGANPKGSAGDLAYLDDATDEANQRLVNLTTERPRQAGRRLPSKFNRSGSPPNDDSSPNGYNENEANKRGISGSPNPNIPHLLPSFSNSTHGEQTEQSNTGEHFRSGFTRSTDVNHRPQLKGVTGISKSGSLGRSDGPIGSNELSRSQEGLPSKLVGGDGSKSNNGRMQPQMEQLQAQFVQHVNEHKQQVKDLKRQIEQLKDSNRQLRSDMLHSQRVVTERIQALMGEIDEAKKQRASDAVELARLRSMIMQLDAKAIMTTGVRRYPNFSYTRNLTQLVDREGDDDGNATKESDAHSLYDEEEQSEQEKVLTVADTGVQKNGDSQQMLASTANNTTRNQVMGRSRTGHPISISRS